MRLLLSVLTLGFLCERTLSLPTQAAGCLGGVASVGGSHLDFGEGSTSGRQGAGGDLASANTVFKVNGVAIDPDSSDVLVFPIGEDVTWEVEALELDFRGILVRLEAPSGVDTTAVLSGDGADLQPATICIGPVVGITHNSNSDKTSATGTFRFDEAVSDVVIDLTTVYRNGQANEPDGENTSIYAYNQFTLNFAEQEGEAPTQSPVSGVSPVPDPTDEPTFSAAPSFSGAPSFSAAPSASDPFVPPPVSPPITPPVPAAPVPEPLAPVSPPVDVKVPEPTAPAPAPAPDGDGDGDGDDEDDEECPASKKSKSKSKSKKTKSSKSMSSKSLKSKSKKKSCKSIKGKSKKSKSKSSKTSKSKRKSSKTSKSKKSKSSKTSKAGDSKSNSESKKRRALRRNK